MGDTISDSITVGAVMLFVSNNLHHNRRRSDRWTVTKIGRKWITFDSGYRADKETLEVDGAGYSSPGNLWLSEKAYEDAARRARLWRDLVSKIRDLSWSAPKHITEAEIHQIAGIVGIELAKENADE